MRIGKYIRMDIPRQDAPIRSSWRHDLHLSPRLRAMTDSLMLVAGPIVFAFCCMLWRRCQKKTISIVSCFEGAVKQQ